MIKFKKTVRNHPVYKQNYGPAISKIAYFCIKRGIRAPSLNYDFNVKRIERYLTLAWQSSAIPVAILTKADLVDDYTEQVKAVEKIAVSVGVYAVSAKTGYGLDTLSEYLKPRKTIVFLGSSGVGKSSLVNALAGEEIMAVNDIREDDSKGHHTTTHRKLPNAGLYDRY